MNNKSVKDPMKSNHRIKVLGKALRKNRNKFPCYQEMKPSRISDLLKLYD